jgi:hypothetical protein
MSFPSRHSFFCFIVSPLQQRHQPLLSSAPFLLHSLCCSASFSSFFFFYLGRYSAAASLSLFPCPRIVFRQWLPLDGSQASATNIFPGVRVSLPPLSSESNGTGLDGTTPALSITFSGWILILRRAWPVFSSFLVVMDWRTQHPFLVEAAYYG